MNPPPPADVPDCLAQTVDYLRNEGMQQMTQGFITRMAIAHTHFEAVHPFRDGNGRVARLLLPLMMAAEKHVPLYLSPYIESKKARTTLRLRMLNNGSTGSPSSPSWPTP
ncbi:Fic family protein [Bradyrhizobium sp. BWA-3-5]|uniref:Fic family protein n=1 Tax=Bradyrhizobium sp. BWA-3-5 TaxID=3080013 RepID=UPI00293EE5FC|nr:Fic family protein [Bradyrhizobium sp. BWA-3-5]WOH64344.1 Fic family protein [Bradyrhizobium sp. BWA-3-5]